MNFREIAKMFGFVTSLLAFACLVGVMKAHRVADSQVWQQLDSIAPGFTMWFTMAVIALSMGLVVALVALFTGEEEPPAIVQSSNEALLKLRRTLDTRNDAIRLKDSKIAELEIQIQDLQGRLAGPKFRAETERAEHATANAEREVVEKLKAQIATLNMEKAGLLARLEEAPTSVAAEAYGEYEKQISKLQLDLSVLENSLIEKSAEIERVRAEAKAPPVSPELMKQLEAIASNTEEASFQLSAMLEAGTKHAEVLHGYFAMVAENPDKLSSLMKSGHINPGRVRKDLKKLQALVEVNKAKLETYDEINRLSLLKVA